MSKFYKYLEIANGTSLEKDLRTYVGHKNADSLQIVQRQAMDKAEQNIIATYNRASEDEKKEIMNKIDNFNKGPMGSKPLNGIISKLMKVPKTKDPDYDQDTNSAHPIVADKDTRAANYGS